MPYEIECDIFHAYGAGCFCFELDGEEQKKSTEPNGIHCCWHGLCLVSGSYTSETFI